MDYKEATHETLMDFYREKGYKAAITLAEQMLMSKAYKDDFEFISSLHGEICETALELTILEFMRQNKTLTKDWIYSKGIILKNRRNLKAEFITEMDFTLFTPACVFIFECKSYSGDKRLIKQGTLVRDVKSSVRSCDVYSQNKIHKEVLEEWICDFVIQGKVPVIQMCMFDFSKGYLEDCRSRAAKIEMPCLNVNTAIKYICSFKEPVWVMEYLRYAKETIDKMSSVSKQMHLNYVKGLHGKGR